MSQYPTLSYPNSPLPQEQPTALILEPSQKAKSALNSKFPSPETYDTVSDMGTPTSAPPSLAIISQDDPSIFLKTGAILTKYHTPLEILSKTPNAIDRIRLLSYNLFLRPPPTKTNHNNGFGDYKNERLAYFLSPKRNPLINDMHIMCIQEIFGFFNRRKNYCIAKARKLGFKYYTTIGGSWFRMKPIDSGLLILSRYPIVDTDQHVFTVGTHIDGWTQKGVLFARILLPNQVHLLLFNVHLQADYDPRDQNYWNIQKAQLKEVSAFMDQKQTQYPDDQVVLMGDMNVDSLHNRGEEGHEVPESQSSDVYDEMMGILNTNESNLEFHDVLFEQNGKHFVTYGDCEIDSETGEKGKPKEVILTHPNSTCCRHSIDYIFYGRKKSHTEYLLTLEPDSAEVMPFFTKNEHFTQLSDHYGVGAVFHTVIQAQDQDATIGESHEKSALRRTAE